jgi:predicted GNAT family acetyltransferase
MDVEITDQRGESRFEARIDGELAGFATYTREGGVLTIHHTEVFDQFEGMGVAGDLAQWALDGARGQNLAVIPECPFFAGYIKKHPEYVDLVPEDQRQRFGL